MRYVIVVLALLGCVVSALALHVHYSNAVEICDINDHWDCGVVNHSRYSVIAGVPVGMLGVAGYLLIAVLAFAQRRGLVLGASLLGFLFALYLSHIEAHVLQTWCLYCVISQCLIALILIFSGVDLLRSTRLRALYMRRLGVGSGAHGRS